MSLSAENLKCPSYIFFNEITVPWCEILRRRWVKVSELAKTYPIVSTSMPEFLSSQLRRTYHFTNLIPTARSYQLCLFLNSFLWMITWHRVTKADNRLATWSPPLFDLSLSLPKAQLLFALLSLFNNPWMIVVLALPLPLWGLPSSDKSWSRPHRTKQAATELRVRDTRLVLETFFWQITSAANNCLVPVFRLTNARKGGPISTSRLSSDEVRRRKGKNAKKTMIIRSPLHSFNTSTRTSPR